MGKIKPLMILYGLAGTRKHMWPASRRCLSYPQCAGFLAFWCCITKSCCLPVCAGLLQYPLAGNPLHRLNDLAGTQPGTVHESARVSSQHVLSSSELLPKQQVLEQLVTCWQLSQVLCCASGHTRTHHLRNSSGYLSRYWLQALHTVG